MLICSHSLGSEANVPLKWCYTFSDLPSAFAAFEFSNFSRCFSTHGCRSLEGGPAFDSQGSVAVVRPLRLLLLLVLYPLLHLRQVDVSVVLGAIRHEEVPAVI
jgi:hypothetical protein